MRLMNCPFRFSTDSWLISLIQIWHKTQVIEVVGKYQQAYQHREIAFLYHLLFSTQQWLLTFIQRSNRLQQIKIHFSFSFLPPLLKWRQAQLFTVLVRTTCSVFERNLWLEIIHVLTATCSSVFLLNLHIEVCNMETYLKESCRY